MYNYYESFENFEEFAEEYEDLAERLLEEVGEGDWQEEELHLFDDLEDLAEYELYDGIYSEIYEKMHSEFGRLPNPFDCVDLAEFGDKLSWVFRDSSFYWSDGTNVVETLSGGW